MDFDLEDFIVSENKHLFDDPNAFGDGFEKTSSNKVKSWLINLETKEAKLIIDDINDENIPEILKNYDWVEDLEIDSQRIKQIKNLPKNIKKLSLFNNLIEDIPINELPDKLEEINISRNKIETLQNIPMSIKEIDASHNKIQNCYLLTNTNLENLSIEYNLIENMPLFFSGLKKLDISQNKLKNIHNIINTIEDLDISFNEITSISKFPENAKSINAESNKISCIFNNLPNNLEYGDFSDNNIILLPQIPTNIHKIDFANNKINLVNVNIESNLEKLNKDCSIILINNPLEKVSKKILEDSRFRTNKPKESENLNNIKLDSYVEIKLKGTIIL
jgi:hypothetical protein